ncbi:outer membrane protein [Candidatus Albibeggiatoa sp. nov. NOAA]|uniref:outer membrane protein n=1 Tax=Candidatus Albibeggiatoa sp. nov. NOAA TaxID=3162724 RepID=UPI0032FCFA86|nr:porin family protein [Thiotrichaceae bacterium]
MNKKQAALVALLSASSLSVSAAQGFYLSADVGGQIADATANQKGTNGPNTPDYDVENSVVYGLGVGFDTGYNVRVEAELRFRSLDTDDSYRNGLGARANQSFSVNSQMDAMTFMANVLYDFDLDSPIMPYVKAGIGVAKIDTDVTLDIQPTFSQFGIGLWHYPDNDDTNFAWSLGFGARYAFQDNLYLDLEYQYMDMGEAATQVDVNGDHVEADLKSHEITVGISYRF